MDLGIDHLGAMRALVRIVDTGSFSAVAKELRVSTSTVARKISALESALGVALLHRTTHSVSLTEAGSIYHARALTLLADLEDTLRVVSEVNAEPSGPLKLVSPVAFGRKYLAPLVAPFLQRYPTIQLDVRLTDNHSDLVAGGFDLDIHEGESYLDNLVVQQLSRNDSVVCAAPSYLQSKGLPEVPADLERHNCLRYVHPEGDARWHFLDGETRHSVLPSGNLATDHSELLLEATCGGLGISEFEVWLVRDLLESGALRIVLPRYRFDNKLTGSYIYMAYLANRRGSAKVKALRDFITDRIGSIGELSESLMRNIEENR